VTAVGFSAFIIIVALLVDGLLGAALPVAAAWQIVARRAALLGSAGWTGRNAVQARAATVACCCWYWPGPRPQLAFC